MNRRFPMILAVLGATTSTALAAPKPRPYRWDWNDIPGSLQRLQTSKDPVAARIRAQIRNGPLALAKERKLARAWGLPLSTAQWPVKPPKPGDDAKPLYDRARALEDKNNIEWTERFDELLAKARQGEAIAPADMDYLRAEMAKRREVLDLIHRGAAKSAFSLPAPKPGGDSLFPDLARQREVIRHLSTEAQVLALDGRFTEAARVQALAYNAVRQVYRHPTLIAYLVGVALEAIADGGLESILNLAGPDEEVAEAVVAALDQAPNGPILPWAFRGEAWFVTDYSRMAQQEGPEALATLFNGDETVPSLRPQRLTASERASYRRLLDAMEADSLRRLRGLISVAGKPYLESHKAMAQLVPGDLDPQDPVSAWSAYSFQSMASSSVVEARRLARHRVLLAGVSVLAYRARTGSWPDRLEEALTAPTDPLTGKPLGYRREGDGFVVWSAGEKKTFDGRKPGDKRQIEALFRYPR